MILAIDCGNSRIKWGASQDGRWIARGSAAYADAQRLPLDWVALPAPRAVAIANVAGERAHSALAPYLERLPAAARWICAQPRQCGVENGYREPATLGADRWAALIGARALHRGASVVVMAGTATTVDRLDSDGRFRGGLILPGAVLMKNALASNTADLPLASGRWSAAPEATDDAIETGCLEAQAGAIERMHARIGGEALCLLSGGAAALIAPLLNIPVRLVDNLALEGLVRIASE